MKFAFKKICINAPFPTTQYGHIQQTYLVSEHKDNLHARIMSIVDNDEWFINISFDLLEVTYKQRNHLQSLIREYYQNSNIHLVTSATHTHYSHNLYDPKFEEFLFNRVMEGIKELEYKEYENVEVSYQRIHTCPVGKSRLSNYETDLEFLCLLRLYSCDVNFMNIVIHNCHPTTLKATTNFFSAEYPGILLTKLETKYPDTNFTFLQGLSGDISSRFVRSGQEYEDMLKLAENIFVETDKLLNEETIKKPFSSKYNEKIINVEHDLTPIDVSKISSDLSDRELETIEYGKIMRQQLIENNNFLRQALIASYSFGPIKLVYVPNELFSKYMSYVDLNQKMLISYSNGDGPYVLPLDYTQITYEMFYDTWSIKSKNELIETIQSI